jgi:hypothetical protein
VDPFSLTVNRRGPQPRRHAAGISQDPTPAACK